MLKAFQASSCFPTQAELDECHQVNKSHNAILLQKFHDWLQIIQTDKMAQSHMNLANQILPIRSKQESQIIEMKIFHTL